MSKATKDVKQWLHQPTLIISIAAFVISVVTTVVSGYRTYRQDIEARKTELRALILQYNSAQLQSIELLSKHQNDPALPTITSTLNSQNIVTIQQAYALAKELGRDVSSADCGIIAYALSDVGFMALSEEMNLKALQLATNATEYLGATRQLAMLKMQIRQTEEAENYWKMAFDVFDVYPKDAVNEAYVRYQHAWTNLSWADLSQDCKTLLDHLAAANKEIDAFGAATPNDLAQWRIKLANKARACSTPTTAGAIPSEILTPNASSDPWLRLPAQK